MTKRLVLIALLVLVSLFSLSACLVSKSDVPQATPTNAGIASTPTGMGVIQAIPTTTYVLGQTQTALAAMLFNSLPSPTPTQQAANGTLTIVPPTGVATVAGTAALTPVVIVPTTTPGRPTSYTLELGEHPYCLARRFNLDPQDLLELNNISSNEVLQPGTVLQIPQSGTYPGTRALHPHPATYTVLVNDTINKIACYYGDVDPSSIALANSLTAPYLLTTGRVLNIP